MAEEILQTQITRPSPIIEEGQKAYLEALRDQVKTPLATSAFAPSVVSRGALEQAAQQQAATQAGLGTLGFDQQGAISTVGTGTGIAGFQPFLDAASAAATQAGTDVASARGLVGPTAYQQFLSPYQTAVRDATLASFDEQAAARQQAISDQAVAAGGFGGGREGVQLAEYQRKSDLDRALLQAQLNQQGFTQAQQLAGQAFSQFGNLGQLQQGLGSQQASFAQLQPSLAAQNIGMVGQLGQQDFSFRQAQADAAREAERMRQFEPIDRLARLGQGITGLTPGGGTVTTTSGVPAAPPSPIGSALTAGIGAFGLGKLFGFSEGGRVGFQNGTPEEMIDDVDNFFSRKPKTDMGPDDVPSRLGMNNIEKLEKDLRELLDDFRTYKMMGGTDSFQEFANKPKREI